MGTEIETADTVRYAGFWIRFVAMIVDTIILMLIMMVAAMVFGAAVMNPEMGMMTWSVFNIILPAILVVLLWRYWGATPGKMMFKAVIVDAQSLKPPTTGQLLIRYFAYILSTIPLCLGFLWIAWDAKKQSFHDKLARTVVVRR